MNSPLVSIIVPCHNRAHLLSQTMESVFAQSYRPVEIVVIDDGSADETPKLMKRYRDKIRYVRQESQGVAVARTTGGRIAKGDFIAFQDDDDLMAPDRINNLMHGFEKYPKAILSVGDYALIDAEGNRTGEESHFKIHSELADSSPGPILIEDGYAAVLWPRVTPLPHTTLFRRKDAEDIGWFDPSFSHACSDTDFFARLGQLGPIVYVPEIVSFYRTGHSSIWKKKVSATYSRFMLFEKHIKSIGDYRDKLQKRLKYRLYETLKLLAVFDRFDKTEQNLPENVWKRGLALLGLKGRLKFKLYKACILPFKNEDPESNFSSY